MPQWDRDQSNRARFWPHGSTQAAKLKTHAGYLMKYLSKMGQFHVFPKGLRAYGVSGLSAVARGIRAWYGLPEWVRRTYGVSGARRLNGRIIDMATGELLPPMFRASFGGGNITLECLRAYPDRVHDGPYSTLEP